MLEDASWVMPFIETWAKAKLPGASTGAKYSFDEFPPPDQYATLAAEFAREGAKPL